MTDWDHIQDVFAQASELPPAERDAFVRQACSGREREETEVRKLLAAQGNLADFLARPLARLDPPELTLTLGDSVTSRYVIAREIGHGGFGRVYLAEDRQLANKNVVVKVMERSSPDGWTARSFEREIQVLASLNHPGIVQVFDSGAIGDIPYLVMQYVPGGNLRQSMEANPPPWPLHKVVDLLRHLAAALDAAHRHGVCHRDLKPENILMSHVGTRDERPVLADFGLAIPSARAEGASTTRVAGSPDYMAPEQLMGRPVPASDIYSLGAIVFELLTGGKLLASEEATRPEDVVKGVLTRQRPDIPEGAREALALAVRFEWRSRYQNATIFHDEFAAGAASQTRPRKNASTRATARPRFRLAAVAVGVILCVVAGIWIYRHPARPLPVEPMRHVSPLDEADYRSPTISPDGKFVAYLSNRSKPDAPAQLFIQPAQGGEPVQLTHGWDNLNPPFFAPDGTRVYYGRFKWDKGEWVTESVPIVGGQPKLVAESRTLGVSPDGKTLITRPAGVNVFLVPSDGGSLQPVPGLAAISTGAVSVEVAGWTADGRYILAHASEDKNPFATDWMALPMEGGEPIPTGIKKSFEDAGIHQPWLTARIYGDRVICEVRQSDLSFSWEVRLAPGNPRVQGAPRQLTSGTESLLVGGISSAGLAAVQSSSARGDLYFVPMNAAKGEVTGPPRRLTADGRNKSDPRFSPGADQIIFTDLSGLRYAALSVATGKEIFLCSFQDCAGAPVVLAGHRLLRASPGGDLSVVKMDSSPPHSPAIGLVCAKCGRIPSPSSEDGLVFFEAGESGSQGDVPIHLMNIAEGRSAPWIVLPNLSNPVLGLFGTDHSWIMATGVKPMLVPWKKGIGNEESIEIPARFPLLNSAKTDLIYYFEGIDLMARRFDARTRRFGKAFAVQFPQGSTNLWAGSAATIGDPGMAFVRPVVRSGVWLTKLPH